VTEAEHNPNAATVAFESVDGPPRAVFDRLVARLDTAARDRQVAVVSRKSPARYRVRVYLAAKIEPRRTAVDWIWDVYDSDLQRAIRIGGEERASRAGDDAWAAADDGVLGQIAEAGMRQLAAFAAASDHLTTAPEMARPAPVHPPAAPPAAGIRVAAASASAAGPDGRTR
jgi:hypothetical protein